jgi:hypothetical protein
MRNDEKEKSGLTLPLTYEPRLISDPPVPDSRVPALAALASALIWWGVFAFAPDYGPGTIFGNTTAYVLFALLAIGSVSLIAAWLHERIPWPTRVAALVLATCWGMTFVVLCFVATRVLSHVDVFLFPWRF